MKEEFKEIKFRKESLDLIKHCDAVIEDYQAQGLRLTLRQLYYQMVSRNIIPNLERSYKNLSNLVSDARLAGLLDWHAIEDRGRQPRATSEFKNLNELIEAAIDSYELRRRDTQHYYIEVWIEKEALAGVIQPITIDEHIVLMVNKGYTSQSAMYNAADRFKCRQHNQSGLLLYMGDFDPSGEDMVRDIQDRLTMFLAPVVVKKIALTREQIDQYNPPPNPAKRSDPRSSAFIQEHGASSWELDALPPNVLQAVLKKEIEEYTDRKLWNKIIKEENAGKRKLKDILVKEK